MKKFLAFSSMFGFIIWLIYSLYERFVKEIPDIIAYPMLVVSILLVMIGLVYNGWCFGKKRNPYDFRT